jgi:hypothetical protein
MPIGAIGSRCEFDAMAARRSIELYSRFPWSWASLTCALGLQARHEAARETCAVLCQ